MTQPVDDRLLQAVAELAREEHLQLMSQELEDEAFRELSEAEQLSLASAIGAQLAEERPAARSQGPSEPTGSPRSARPWRGLRRQLAWLAAAAALFSAGLWLALRVWPGGESAAQLAAAGDDRQLTLPGGSTLALAEHTDARVVALDPQEVRVRLDRGRVECDVAHNPARRFVVAVRGWEVVVKGTRFTVSAGVDGSAEQVSVSVERGLVEVRQPPERVLALLGAGQRWSSTEPAPTPVPEPAPEPEPEPAPIETLAPPTAPSAPRLEPNTPAPAAPAPRPPPVAREHATPTARSLFERGDAERLAGHAREAAAAFDELRRRYPTDARAGYAAFMLGRIRLDTLADASGAAEAFAFALAHPGGGFFLEDAAARRVEALAKAGPASECAAAREQFLASYPKAARASFVARLCGAR